MHPFKLALIFCLVATAGLAKPMTCRSWQGMEVPYLGDASLDVIGGATRNARGRDVILVNPEILVMLEPLARDFFLAHECGHHALIPDYNTEPEADCYAMRRMRKKLVTTPQDLRALQDALTALPPEIWQNHRPDADRISNLGQCGTE